MTTFNESQAKETINNIMLEVSFRKFGNAFRKHINPRFSSYYNMKADGGQVCDTLLWSELASYIIGDGAYSVTEEQFNGFVSQLKSK